MYRQEGENLISWSLPPWTGLMISSFLAWSRSSGRLRASLVLDLRASAWSARSFLPALSAFSVWVCSMRIRLFLNRLHFTFRYRLTHVAVSLLRLTASPEQPAQNSHPAHPGHLLRHSSTGSALLLTHPHMPALPPSQGVFAASSQERTATGFRMISPSLISFRICWRELALASSLVSLGSKQTFFLPQRRTREASLLRSLSILTAAAAAAKGDGEIFSVKIFNSRVAIHKLM